MQYFKPQIYIKKSREETKLYLILHSRNKSNELRNYNILIKKKKNSDCMRVKTKLNYNSICISHKLFHNVVYQNSSMH